VDVSPYDDVLQQVRVPAGTSVITFTFTPPHVLFGYAAFLLGLACLVVLPFRRRARHRPTHRNYRERSEDPGSQGPMTPDDRPRVPVPDGRPVRSTPDRSFMPSGGIER
jgi:hypothetical protein